ncbi:uncharacterized protein C6G9.01c [Amaranthus tricolor]|uniref:uncharacterized protein C6G9.01c n=1 Tax=Amaranthus tricolor TaxID=29722 RepID=UPI00258B8B38|nr:uncharacterized protein C6G9.01c [Amaranthus tricolor]XP_057524818.1 uncharacterized protein C6G9.01c [Amaranthus tricolor]XP_057524819.1 uncharacterized protein C6G9.01c [Amaranthus tricolor]
MPKKRSSKSSVGLKEEPNAANKSKKEPNSALENPSTNSKKIDEIDQIFASQKRKKTEKEKAENSSKINEKSKKIKKKKIPKDSEVFNSNSKPRRRTNNGLPIYSEEELGINNQDGGDTALCPFDCSCCF